MKNSTRLVACFVIGAFLLLIASIWVHLDGGQHKHLSILLALSAGISGLIGGFMGLVFSKDTQKPKISITG